MPNSAGAVSSAVAILPSNPGANYLAYKRPIDRAIQSVLENGWYILGQEVSEFEEEFARYIGVDHGIGVASGTDALQIALRACGIGAGHSVISVSHTAVATICAIQLTGATPVLVDINAATFTIDLNRVEDALKSDVQKEVKAIVPVHLYGHPVDVSGIMALADRYGLYVIEDCAQAHGAQHRNRRVGSCGHFGAFSFYPTKNLGALGDGGALVTNDSDLANKARMLRQYGWRQRYISEMPGLNSRLDELQAAVLRVKLRYLDEDNEKRRRIAGTYARALSGSSLISPTERDGCSHVYHQYVIRCGRRDVLREFLKRNAIETAILYPLPVHLQPGYRDKVVIGPGGLGVTEEVCREILSLPMYPELTDDDVARVGQVLAQWK
jgi:dTDP-4-amino-4,6-dideoxygalactose transaminase